MSSELLQLVQARRELDRSDSDSDLGSGSIERLSSLSGFARSDTAPSVERVDSDPELAQPFRDYLGPTRAAKLDFVAGVAALQSMQWGDDARTLARQLYAAYLAPQPTVAALAPPVAAAAAADDDTVDFDAELARRSSIDELVELFAACFLSVSAELEQHVADFVANAHAPSRSARSLASVPMLNLASLSARPGSTNDILSLMNHELSARYHSNRAPQLAQRGCYLPERQRGPHPNRQFPLQVWKCLPPARAASPPSAAGAQGDKGKRRRSRSAINTLLKWSERE